MFDEEGQINYWKSLAVEDLETAEILLDKNKLRECLFFCHLCIEKILKAHYVKVKKDLAPKTHRLQYLADRANIELNTNLDDFFGVLMSYQLEGRYPDDNPNIPKKLITKSYLEKTKEVLLWLIQIL
jgi:HEPN domain-containing protein